MKPAIAVAVLAMTVSPAFADDSATARLKAVNDRFNAAAAAHDADALVSLYADDMLWIAQGAPVTQGLEGPRALFDYVAAHKGNVSHTIDHLFVSEDATLAVMIGSVEAVIESQGMVATGTYLFVLEPEDDGWEIVTDMWHQHGPH